MRSIYGEDLGTSIEWRSITEGQYLTKVEARHPWPAETAVSAGRGVVFGNKDSDSYTTLFMEVYPPGASFIRGEGATTEECEDSCWKQYQNALHCPGPTSEHEWEPRGYTNGAGFCKHCGTFESGRFTAEQLGQFCHACKVPTMRSTDGHGKWGCDEHLLEKDEATKSGLEKLFDSMREDRT